MVQSLLLESLCFFFFLSFKLGYEVFNTICAFFPPAALVGTSLVSAWPTGLEANNILTYPKLEEEEVHIEAGSGCMPALRDEELAM